MLSWLSKKGQNSRVYMCIKELKWELEKAHAVRRATILAVAQFFRNETFSGAGISMDVFDRPLDYSRNDLMSFYERLETIRNHNTMQIEATRKNMRRLSMELPQFAVDHAKTTTRSLEVWMCTLGAGIAVDRRDDVRAIWGYLASSVGQIEKAILHIRHVEQQTAAMTGTHDLAVFSVFDTNEWIDLCGFVPSVFLKDLHLD